MGGGYMLGVPRMPFISSIHHCLHSNYLALLISPHPPKNYMQCSRFGWFTDDHTLEKCSSDKWKKTGMVVSNPTFVSLTGHHFQFEQRSSCASLISLRKLIKAYFQSQLRANLLYCLCLLVNWPQRKALSLETLLKSD